MAPRGALAASASPPEQQQQQQLRASSLPPEDADDPKVLQRLKVDLSDATALKHKLDETASEVILQSGYVEDHLNSNVKLALGLLGIAVALYSHFCPGKFPANWGTVAACVASYVAINLVLLVFSHIKEGDSFLVTPPKPGSEYGLRVGSRMDRYCDQYTLTIASANKWEDREVKMQASVTSYFHADGYLAANRFARDVGKLLKQFERLDASSGPRPKALTPGKAD